MESIDLDFFKKINSSEADCKSNQANYDENYSDHDYGMPISIPLKGINETTC